MRPIASHLSFANIVASLALFISVGGVSWAAVTLPRNSVGSKQLKRNAVTSTKVKNGSLLAADFKATRLPAGPQGPQGPQGPAGASGPKGDSGPVTGELPAGATLRGIFNLDFVAAGADEIEGAAISFGLRLATAPAVVILAPGAQPTPACPGSTTDPQAGAGTLCLYENGAGSNVKLLAVCNFLCPSDTAERQGTELFLRSKAAGRTFIDGSWAVTAG